MIDHIIIIIVVIMILMTTHLVRNFTLVLRVS